MNQTTHARLVLAGVFTLAFAFICLAVIALLGTPPHPASAAPKSNLSKALGASPLQQTAIFTDAYDAIGVNDQVTSASSIPIAFCSAPSPITYLTLYRAIPSPASDIDFYRITPGAQKLITVTVTVANSDLVVRVNLIDSTGSSVIASSIGQDITLNGLGLTQKPFLWGGHARIDTCSHRVIHVSPDR